MKTQILLIALLLLSRVCCFSQAPKMETLSNRGMYLLHAWDQYIVDPSKWEEVYNYVRSNKITYVCISGINGKDGTYPINTDENASDHVDATWAPILSSFIEGLNAAGVEEVGAVAFSTEGSTGIGQYDKRKVLEALQTIKGIAVYNLTDVYKGKINIINHY